MPRVPIASLNGSRRSQTLLIVPLDWLKFAAEQVNRLLRRELSKP